MVKKRPAPAESYEEFISETREHLESDDAEVEEVFEDALEFFTIDSTTLRELKHSARDGKISSIKRLLSLFKRS